MLTFEQMKELIELVSRLGLGGTEVRNGDFRFSVDGHSPGATATTNGAPIPAAVAAASDPALASVAPSPPAAGTQSAPENSGPSSTPVEVDPPGYILTSPIVGTFYRAPSPEAEPYAQPGDRVEKGQVLCIVEAMKLMNEVESDVAGVVLEVLPENAQPVEFGEPLFSIKKD